MPIKADFLLFDEFWALNAEVLVMRKFSMALATAAVLTASVPSFGTAQAVPIGTTNGLRITVNRLTMH